MKGMQMATDAQDNRARLASLTVLASITSMSLGAAFAKTLFHEVGAEGITALRVGYSALLLVIFTRPWRVRLTRSMILNLGIYGLMLGLMNIFIYQAFARIPLGTAIAIEVTGPLAVALLSSRRPIDFACIACAVLGLYLLLPISDMGASLDGVGVAFAFGAATCWAIYIVVGRRVSTLNSGQAVAMGMIVASVFAVPLGAVHAGSTLLTPHVLAAGLLVALMSSAVPYVLEISAMRHLPQRVFGILLSSSPAIGAIVAFAVLGEALSTGQWLAIACIMLASAGSAFAASKHNSDQRMKESELPENSTLMPPLTAAHLKS